MLCITDTEIQHLRSGTITHLDALLLNKVISLSARSGWATVSAGALAQMLCCSLQTAHLSCKKLQSLGFLESERLQGIPVRKKYRRGHALLDPAKEDAAPAGKVTLVSLGASSECLQVISAWLGTATRFIQERHSEGARKKIADICAEIEASGLEAVLGTVELHKQVSHTVPADRKSLVPGWGYFDRTRVGRCTLWEPATGAWAELAGTAQVRKPAAAPADALRSLMVLARSEPGQTLAAVGDAARAAGAAGEKILEACMEMERIGEKMVGPSVYKAMDVPFVWEGDYASAWRDVLASFSKEVF